MDTSTAHLGMYPLHRCKILHLVRHAEGFHNTAGKRDCTCDECLSKDYFDPGLTPLGWEQVDNLRKHVQATGLSKKIELVITDPMMRTMQTAVGVFGGGGYSNGINAPPLMVADAANSGRPAISSLNCPPFLALEICRTRWGIFPSSKRRSKREYESVFPAIDFSLIETEEDTWWKEDIRETVEQVQARARKFAKWLCTRKEKEIAFVNHGGLVQHMLTAFLNDCHPTVKTEFCKYFDNCELQSMIIVDKGMIGCEEFPTNNIPAKVANGPDLPSDIADELQHAEETS